MKTVKQVITQMIPVVLGVLIALLLNNWKEETANKRFLTQVLSSIHQEMSDEKEDIQNVIPKQQSLLDTLNHYLEDETLSISDCIIKNRGFQVVTTKNTSWWSFLNTKIEIVGYKTISTLSEIESSKQFMSLKTSKMMDFIYEHSESRETKAKKMFITQILNLMDSEQGLLVSIDEYLDSEEL